MFSKKQTFEDQVDAVLAGENINALHLGKTPKSLTMVGLPDVELKTTQHVIRKINNEQHGLSVQTIKVLPDLQANPMMVFKSATTQESFVVVVDEKRGDATMIVAIKKDGTVERVRPVNVITSSYFKPNGVIDNWLKSGLLLGADKQKALVWTTREGLQLPILVQSINKSLDLRLRQNNDEVNGVTGNTVTAIQAK